MSGNRIHKWGIIGTGRIAADFVQALRLVPNAKVVAVASHFEEERAKRFAAEWNIANYYGSVAALAADEEVEIVYVAVLHPYHKDAAVTALNAGKHVLCEKPLAMNASEAKEMIETARKKGRFFMEAMWTRHFPAFLKLQELIRTNKLGTITSVHANFGFVANPNTPRLNEKSFGAGSLLDIGIYILSLASAIFGPEAPERVEAIGEIDGRGIDQQVGILLGYKRGIAILHCAFNAELPCEAHIMGTAATAKIHKPFWCPTHITVESKNHKEEYTFNLPSPDGAKFNFRNSAGLHYEAQHLQECIEQGKLESDRISLDESLTIMQTLEKIFQIIGLQYK